MRNTSNPIAHFFPTRQALKHSFTLIEVLIVLSLIALISAVVAISVNKMHVNQQFRNEVSLVVDQLRLAQDMMLILDTDVHVMFAEDTENGGNKVWIEGETKLPKGVQNELERKHILLKQIKGVFFHDELAGEITPGKLDIKFLSKGAVMSKGVMRLATSDQLSPPSNVLQNYICLPGYIKPIFSYDRQEEAIQACTSLEDEDFDRQLTQDTFARLPEKMMQEKQEGPSGAESPEKKQDEQPQKGRKKE